MSRRAFAATTVLIVTAIIGPGLLMAQCESPELAKLEASNAASQYFYGHAVAVEGDVAVVGAYRDWTAGHEAGRVFVYRLEGAAWVEEAQLVPADIGDDDEFGISVGISGTAIVVGSHFDDDGGPDSGAAYVFEYDGSSWSESAKLTASDATGWDNFGYSVAIDGDVIVVGANLDDHPEANSGSAYIFEKPTGGWTDMTETDLIVSDDIGTNHEFGKSVSVSGGAIVVGAHFVTVGELTQCGAAYVFEDGASGWSQSAKLTTSDADVRDRLGISVAVDGETVVAGAWGDDDGGSSSGSAYLFAKPGTGWADMTETAKLNASDGEAGDHFGWTVAVSGTHVVVGAPAHNFDGNGFGAAYAFTEPAGGWADATEDVRYTGSDGAEDDQFALSVDVDGSRTVVGAPFHATGMYYGAGASYIHGGLADCQPNGTLDACDISSGASTDGNGDGVPDECESAGEGSGSIEGSLILSKTGSEEITLSWAASCLGTDDDYAVYEGTLGDYASHQSRFCTTGGLTASTFLPAVGDTYYLVVPGSAVYEGSYGPGVDGAERDSAAEPCAVKLVTACPE